MTLFFVFVNFAHLFATDSHEGRFGTSPAPPSCKRTEGQEYPGERAEPGAGRHTDAGRSSHQGDEGDVRVPDPAGKMGQPEEIATVALFLDSDDSSFVYGVQLSVDGGLSAI